MLLRRIPCFESFFQNIAALCEYFRLEVAGGAEATGRDGSGIHLIHIHIEFVISFGNLQRFMSERMKVLNKLRF